MSRPTGRTLQLGHLYEKHHHRRWRPWLRSAWVNNRRRRLSDRRALAALLLRSYAPFFYLTSFTHYAVYIATYHQRKGIAFGAFKRGAPA